MTPLPDAFRTVPLAHRALHDRSKGRPENSRAAVRAAVEAGYGIEIDVQLSADGLSMVFHDYDLGRLTDCSGPLRQIDSATLREIRLKDGTEGIPTLREILEIVDSRVPLLIEIKDQDGGLGPDVGALEHATVAALAGYSGPVALMSFNPHSVAECARLAPGTPRGLTTCDFAPKDWKLVQTQVLDRLRGIPDYAAVGASFISHQHDDLDRAEVTEIRQAGGAILCWTIRSEAAEKAARRIAHNITFEGYLAALPDA